MTVHSQIASHYSLESVIGQSSNSQCSVIEAIVPSNQLICALSASYSLLGEGTDYLRAIPPELGLGNAISEAEFLVLGGVHVKNVYDPLSAFFHTVTPVTVRDVLLNYPDIQYADLGGSTEAYLTELKDDQMMIETLRQHIIPTLYNNPFQSWLLDPVSNFFWGEP